MLNNSPTSLICIKLGGSVITDRTKPSTPRPDRISYFAQVIANFRQKNPNVALLLAHGQGSYAHFPAHEYGIAQSLHNHPDAVFGWALTAQTVRELTQLVTQSLLDQHIPAASIFPAQTLITNNRQAASHFFELVDTYLRTGILPVTTGDVIMDRATGGCIWSADTVLPYIALLLKDRGWDVKEIIHVTSTPGVYRDLSQPKLGVFSTLTKADEPLLKQSVKASHHVDVTGGMLTKVTESIELANQGIPSVILSGEDDSLEKYLAGAAITCTRIEPSS